MFKKNIYLFLLIILLNSCAGDTFDSFKRGVTGEKQKSSDEFLVEKKSPLVMPPDFDELPIPKETVIQKDVNEEAKKFGLIDSVVEKRK